MVDGESWFSAIRYRSILSQVADDGVFVVVVFAEFVFRKHVIITGDVDLVW